jgi:hypothetical protein
LTVTFVSVDASGFDRLYWIVYIWKPYGMCCTFRFLFRQSISPLCLPCFAFWYSVAVSSGLCI